MDENFNNNLKRLEMRLFKEGLPRVQMINLNQVISKSLKI